MRVCQLLRNERFLNMVVGLVSVLAFLLVWHAATTYAWVDAAFVPPLAAIYAALIDLLRGGEIADNLGATLSSGGAGLLLGAVIGIPLGLGMAVNSGVENFFNPLLKSSYALPKTTLIPLLVLCFGVGQGTNITVVMVTSLLPICLYTYRGVKETPRIFRWSALSMGTSAISVGYRILLPAALPSILTGVRIALGFAFLVVLACEMIVANQGIGKLIFQYGDFGNYDYMFASLLVVIVVAFLVDLLLVSASRYFLRWHEVFSGR